MSSSPPFSYQRGHIQTTHPGTVQNFIDNELRASQALSFTDVHDPATSKLVARVPQSTDEELRSAVQSAQNAFLKWRRLSVIARQKIMFQFVTLIRQHGDRLAESITLEQGKTLADAKADVYRGLQVAEVFLPRCTQDCRIQHLADSLLSPSDRLRHHHANCGTCVRSCSRHGDTPVLRAARSRGGDMSIQLPGYDSTLVDPNSCCDRQLHYRQAVRKRSWCCHDSCTIG